ncbi:MAG: hypothetical protein CR982_08220 [Candidatus Cloacimonadota bacterium]|nr:MAG: hypothetical protein CR982_08220 [Candidatus Cloacimonadota bacterium]PIE77661.1 MAG: hypothetical protein CSA15_12120 [Candidatus Delongbacteria bacterium]
MNYHKEIRQSYLGGFPILLLESFFWILAGFVWDFVSFKIGIMVIIISGTFFYPLTLLLQTILKRPKISKENPLNLLFTQISLIIPFSFPLIFLLVKENRILFFPALTIIVGAHYLPFIYPYKMKSYWILASLLVVGGSLFGFIMNENTHYCAYYTGSVLLLFAIINYYLIKREISKSTT